MNPQIWGPGLWTFLHSTAAVSTTPQSRRDYVVLVEALANTLPCDKCKQHFRQNMRTININNYLKNEETLFMWSYLLHNAVNEAQGKSGAQKPTFDEIYRRYFNVGDDSSAVLGGEYQDKVCKQICSSSASNDGTFPAEHNVANEKKERVFKSRR
jgi:hypothetical protein